jgi:tRNA(Ile)-lysidine synthase
MRFWEEKGEKFQPLGLRGSKKLQDFFIDRKVPPSLRSRIPLFFDNAKLIWVAGYEIDERVKLTDKTVKIFHIKIFKN